MCVSEWVSRVCSTRVHKSVNETLKTCLFKYCKWRAHANAIVRVFGFHCFCCAAACALICIKPVHCVALRKWQPFQFSHQRASIILKIFIFICCNWNSRMFNTSAGRTLQCKWMRRFFCRTTHVCEGVIFNAYVLVYVCERWAENIIIIIIPFIISILIKDSITKHWIRRASTTRLRWRYKVTSSSRCNSNNIHYLRMQCSRLYSRASCATPLELRELNKLCLYSRIIFILKHFIHFVCTARPTHTMSMYYIRRRGACSRLHLHLT